MVTISELYDRFSQVEEWKRLACVCRGRVRDIILKAYGDTDADMLTRERLRQWLDSSGRVPEDTVPVGSVIDHMMQWAGKWRTEVVKPKPKPKPKAKVEQSQESDNADCRKATPALPLSDTVQKQGMEKPKMLRQKAVKKAKSVAKPKEKPKKELKVATPKKQIAKPVVGSDSVQDYADKHGINIYDSPQCGRPATGTIYYDGGSKGYSKSGQRIFHDCWRAEINISGQRYRHRSKDRKDCDDWLKAVKQGKIKPTDNKADWWRMEQRKDEEVRIDEIIVSQAEESVLLYDYHQTKDLTKISDYVVQRLLPHMTYYCAHTLNFGKDRTLTASRQAIALLLTRITAGRPVLNFTSTCKRMLRVHKDRGNFFYYENAPKEVKMVCNRLDLSALADVWKVTKDRRI